MPLLIEKKRRHEPLVMVTAYDFPTARAAEQAGVDLVLAGDTAAMTMLGYSGTEYVSLEEMLMLTKAVRRGLQTPLLVGDLPFGSYESSHEQAVSSALRLVKEAGCDVVKFEGPSPARAAAIVAAGVPVMGHLGLTPQTATALGGFKAQARTAVAGVRLVEEALQLQEAGCCALVLEAVPAEVAATVSRLLTIPTIGIGAGAGTDGQVLVLDDLLGRFEGFTPRFVKRYAEIQRETVAALETYVSEVRERRFPSSEHAYHLGATESERFQSLLASDKQ